MPMVYFKENYNFPRFQRGSNIFSREGVQLFLGGSNFLFPIESHITCVFPGGPGPLPPPPPPPPPPPSGSVHAIFCCEKKLTMRKSYQFDPHPPLGIPKCIHGVLENNHSGLTRIQIVFEFFNGSTVTLW